MGFVKYAGAGKLHIAGVEWKDDSFALEDIPAVLTTCGEKTLLNLREEADEGQAKEYYIFGLYTLSDDDTLIFWLPDVDAFERAIDDGLLAGDIDKGSKSKTIVLTPEKSDVNEFIKNHDVKDLFVLDEPMIYRRVKDLN